LDLAKNVFAVHGIDAGGNVVIRGRCGGHSAPAAERNLPKPPDFRYDRRSPRFARKMDRALKS
jgi:hypothetical protein